MAFSKLGRSGVVLLLIDIINGNKYFYEVLISNSKFREFIVVSNRFRSSKGDVKNIALRCVIISLAVKKMQYNTCHTHVYT